MHKLVSRCPYPALSCPLRVHELSASSTAPLRWVSPFAGASGVILPPLSVARHNECMLTNARKSPRFQFGTHVFNLPIRFAITVRDKTITYRVFRLSRTLSGLCGPKNFIY